MTQITLNQAQANCDAALVKAGELQLKPLAVAVLDAGGHVIALQRQDGASILRLRIARAKAAGALALGVSSRKIGELAVERPHFIASVDSMGEGGMVPAAGGVIVVDENGRTIGAEGATGDTTDNDEACSLAGPPLGYGHKNDRRRRAGRTGHGHGST